ncbi:MAG: TetR/AcrR family transcriptional regulator [Candidatus Eisenbacteria bacterium]
MQAGAHAPPEGVRKLVATTKKEAILDAALDLFVEKGISAATTREIARRAGTAEGNLYRHFESKDTLARHLFGDCAGRFRRRLVDAAAAAVEPEARIRSLVRAIFLFAAEEPRAFAFIVLSHHNEFATGPIRNPQPLPKDIFCEAIRSGTESGVFRPVDPNLATSWIVGLTHRAITFAQMGRIRLPGEEVVRETAEAALRLLAAD